MDVPELFRHLLKTIIRSKDRGFQKAIADKCGIDPGHLSDFLAGRKKLSEAKRVVVVEYLGYEYDEFLSMAKHGVEIDSEGNLIPLKATQGIKRIYSRASDQDRPPGDMLANFNNKKKARECIDKLIEIDRIEPEKLEPVEMFLCGFLEGLKPQKKTAENT
jgi:hypothetical protein